MQEEMMHKRTEARLFLLILIAIIIALVWAFPAQSQVYRVQTTKQQCVKGRYCVISRGCGSCVSLGWYTHTTNKFVFATNKHVVDGAQTITVEINGQQHPATYASQDKYGADLALITIDRTPQLTIPCVPLLSGVVPSPGDRITAKGYSHCKPVLRTWNGTALSFPNEQLIWVSGQAVPGDSGGAILNESGQLAGVIFGASQRGETVGVRGDYVREFVRRYGNGQLPTCGQQSPPTQPINPTIPNDNTEILQAIQRIEQRLDSLESHVNSLPDYSITISGLQARLAKIESRTQPDYSGDINRLQTELTRLKGHVLTVELIDDKGEVTKSLKKGAGDTLKLFQNLKKEK